MSNAPSTAGKPAQDLATPVQFLKGVGPQRAALLERLGLHVARALLLFFPRSYQDLSAFRPLPWLPDDRPVASPRTLAGVPRRPAADATTPKTGLPV